MVPRADKGCSLAVDHALMGVAESASALMLQLGTEVVVSFQCEDESEQPARSPTESRGPALLVAPTYGHAEASTSAFMLAVPGLGELGTVRSC